ncbi:hypothetical protein NL676_030199 [Syzygium grande]|nr:hypothetical protein NL676_030199 [Syzygium grande]
MHELVVPERSALYTIAGSESRSRSGNDKQIVKCDYCGKERHTRETCYKLYGRPSNAGRGRGRGRTGPQVHLSEAPGQQPAAPSDSLSAAELTSLRLLLARNVDNPGTSTSSASGTLISNFAQSGSFFGGLCKSSQPWILDSGATHHMTGDITFFTDYSRPPKPDCVTVADGSLAPIAGQGSVSITRDITLSSVLHVPMVYTNLLSIGSLTRDLKCQVVFFPSYCIVQDLATGREIGRGRVEGGLYVFDSPPSAHLVTPTPSATLSELHNGVAERKNRHLLEVARSLMFAMNVPAQYWSDAILSAAYLINRLPSRILQYRSPIEALTGSHKFLVPPKVFGCECFARIAHPASKLAPRSIRCIFLGYSPTQKGYKCYCPSTRRYFISMDVIFHESQPFYSRTPLQGESTEGEDVSSSLDVIPLRGS